MSMCGIIALLPLLGGCGKSLRYEAKELRHITVVTADQWSTREDITVLTKRFTSRDNEYYFNTPYLKCVPIQITVNNQSDQDWVLAPELLNLPLVPMEYVIKEMSPSYGRSYGMSLLFGPQLGSMYSVRQLDAKNRIVHDLASKCLEQPLTIPAGKKCSAVLFVAKRNLKPRCILELGHADIPHKHLTFELSLR
jgi:hypothetical protein